MLTLILVLTITACSANTAATSNAQAANPATNNSATSSSAAQAGSTSSAASTASKTSSSSSNASTTNVSAAIPSGGVTAASVLAENKKTHESNGDYSTSSSNAVAITLNGALITASANSAVVSGSKVTITSAGTYTLTGSLTDGQVIVNSTAKGTVRLVLNNVDIHSAASAPVYIMAADKVIIELADGSKNTLTDGNVYVFADKANEEPNAALFSKADLTIFGSGSLTVNANFRDGISSKDGLIIASGTITVNAADDGIRGKDYLVIKDGKITVNAKGDGLKSDNEEDATRGYISIEKGTITLTSGGDAINAQTDTVITGGEFTLKAGGGSAKASTTVSTKGIKGSVQVVIEGGTFNIDAADDTLHSNGSITINGGKFTLASADDGMHADQSLTINNGDINITKSYEGVESTVLTINNGSLRLVSSDDGINGANASESGSAGMPGGFGRPGAQASTTYTGKVHLYMNGGYVVVNALGDGVDVNGAIDMTGGTLLVSGPTAQNNGAVDYDAYFKMTGGLLVAAGSSGMAMAPSTTSTQYGILVNFSATQAAGTLVHIQDSTGKDILTFAPAKPYQSLAFSSPALVKGGTYTVFTGGKSTGTVTDMLYQGGSYTAGTQAASLTISSILTSAGTATRGMQQR
jgi:hypothetical protein